METLHNIITVNALSSDFALIFSGVMFLLVVALWKENMAFAESHIYPALACVVCFYLSRMIGAAAINVTPGGDAFLKVLTLMLNSGCFIFGAMLLLKVFRMPDDHRAIGEEALPEQVGHQRQEQDGGREE